MPLNLVPRRVSPWLIAVVVLLVVGTLVGVSLQRQRTRTRSSAPQIRTLKAVTPAELVNYAGNDACASCHPGAFEAHQKSEHARALSRVDAASHGERFQRPSSVRDPNRGITYRTGVQGASCVLVATAEAAQTSAKATFGFGSGKHAITYLGQQGDLDLELRLTFYTAANRWGFSPGQQLNSRTGGLVMETGLAHPQESVEECFVCHTTVIAKDNGVLQTGTMMMGVGCEACHGPAQAHVEAARRGDRDLRMGKLSALGAQAVSVQLCGQCHRSPARDDLSDAFNRSQLPRLQGLALPKSLCFTNSEGKLSCLSCHDSHDQSPKPDTFYNAKCVSCHAGTAGKQRVCRVEPKGDCVSCHMPAQSVGMPFDLRYRNHWIKIWSP
jgi:hypothetical protein